MLCYAPDDPAAGWLFVDSPVVPVRLYQAGEGSYTIGDETDPLVRSLRLSSQPFEGGLILTLYGKVLRWDPAGGSTTPAPARHPSRRPSPASSARSEPPPPRQLRFKQTTPTPG